MNFGYYIPTRILFGSGQLKNLHHQALPGRKALIVMSAGNSAKASGALDTLIGELDRANVQYEIFDRILANPIKRHVMEGAAVAKDKNCDFIIGLGGGSSIDASKAIAIMATNPGDYWDYIASGSGKGKPIQNHPLPIVAVTTTAGTGTEADPWTVTTKEETNEKIGFGCDETFPVLSVVDPELMLSVPAHLTAYQGFDALFHSTEGYLANIASPVSDIMALKAIELIGKSLAKATKNGKDIEAREDVALANTLSGMVESLSSCISEHSLEHAMSAYHHDLPHGAGLIMISRAYYAHFAKSGVCDERMVRMAKALGKADAKHAMDFVAVLEELMAACGVENLKMSDYGMEREDLGKYVTNARQTMGGLFALDPVSLTDEDCLAIYQASYR